VRGGALASGTSQAIANLGLAREVNCATMVE
jgi:hypothetical protein